MSWSITVNNLQQDWEQVFREDIVASFLSQHPEHFGDLRAAVEAARSMKLSAATLAGGRTPSPYDGNETVVLTITGVTVGTDYNTTMRKIIGTGPDAEALAQRAKARDA